MAYRGRRNTRGRQIQHLVSPESAYPAEPQYNQMQQDLRQQDWQQKQNNSSLQQLLPPQVPVELTTEDTEMVTDTKNFQTGSDPNKAFLSKVSGVKKITNKERRKRQNAHLRRLLTPKNALMALHEMIPKEQVANGFKVEQNPAGPVYSASAGNNFCADFSIEGTVYKGYGDSKLMARNAAAENAFRDLIIKKMTKVAATENAENDDSEESLPMIQLASYALHKLFSEWEQEGFRVPQLRPGPASDGEEPPAASRKQKPAPAARALPPGAEALHPCMLLTHMRPSVAYRELAAHGSRPHDMTFTIGLEVDGHTFVGKARNKRDARKEAARAACNKLFGIQMQMDLPIQTPLP